MTGFCSLKLAANCCWNQTVLKNTYFSNRLSSFFTLVWCQKGFLVLLKVLKRSEKGFSFAPNQKEKIMGGLSYDRDVYSSGSNYSSSGFHSSSLADHAFKTSDVRALDPKLLPLNRHLECTTKNAIVIALDVTGSMGDSAKLLYDKLPMLWGQLEQQGYLKDFSISFAAVGDCTCDGAPFSSV